MTPYRDRLGPGYYRLNLPGEPDPVRVEKLMEQFHARQQARLQEIERESAPEQQVTSSYYPT